MRVYFWLGVSLVYLGFALLVGETILERELLKRPLWLQIGFVALAFLFCGIFSIEIVGAHAPIASYSYAMRNGEYSPDTVISGIIWDSHFTDLRVALTNSSDADYEDVDVTIRPDKWVYRASLVTDHSGCELSPVVGNSSSGNALYWTRAKQDGKTNITATKAGTDFDIHDNSGNVYTLLASQSGYRLRCARFPSRFTVLIVFAAVTVPSDALLDKITPGTWGVKITGDATPNLPVFNHLGPRPYPLALVLKGRYRKILKSYSINETIAVRNGS
jgi:hypothetical protein